MLKKIGIDVFQFIFNIDDANEILPGIWLGNYKAARNPDFFEKNGIQAVINCTKTTPFLHGFNVEKYRVSVDDAHRDLLKMGRYIDRASVTLNRYMSKNKRVLIHCHAGLQRSATVLAYTLMKYNGFSMDQAISLIKSKRRRAFPPPFTFYKILHTAERRLRRI